MPVTSGTPLPDDDGFQRALAGQYTIEREIGRGGMGIVYLGREVLLDRPVAIKRLPSRHGPDDAEQRFLREAQTAARLFHPHIVPIHRVESTGEFVYFAMGFVDGESAGQRVLRRGPMSIADALRLLRETAWALGYAHARGVVHRDVKPDNLLIEHDSSRTFVTDFGIAQQAGASTLTGEGMLLGSIRYMSPEQIAGGNVDGRSDLYALGIVAHFVLTGHVPFEHQSATAVLGMHTTRAAPPIASLVPGIPARLASAIDRCLEKDPAVRFQTAEAFADAIADAERSRMVPAPLRAWAAGAGWIDAGFPVVMLLSFVIAAASVAPVWLMLLPLVYAIGQWTRHTRRLFSQGYDTGDLQRALLAELEKRSEESAAQFSGVAPRWVGIIRKVAKAAFGTSIALFVATPFVGPRLLDGRIVNDSDWAGQLNSAFENAILITLAVAVFGTLIAELASPSRMLALPQDGGLRLALRFWKSRHGLRLARLLQFRLRGTAHTGADRPTEFVIGSAASTLFAALPLATRQRFAEVPDVIARLEEHAQRLRARRESIERIAASVQETPSRPALEASSVGERRAQTVDELAQARDVIEQRLAAIVAALEIIRLDLLRLHAGSGSTVDLTGALNAAVRISDEVTLSLESWAEVERLTAAPSQMA